MNKRIKKKQDRFFRAPFDIFDISACVSEWTVETIFRLAEYFETSVDTVIRVFDSSGFWDVINDDELGLLWAHDNITDVIEHLEKDFEEIMSQGN